MISLIDQLQANTTLTDAERYVANYVLNHQDSVSTLSIYSLAEQTQTSPSTITRLCKKCGLTNFPAFKVALARDYATHLASISHIDANMPFLPSDNDSIIATKIAALSKETITATTELISNNQLKRVVDLILNSKSIYAVGVSGNFIRLRDFQLKLLKIKIYVHLLDLQAEQYYLALNATDQDCALLISISGRTAEIVNDAKHFRESNTPIIALTADPNSPLATYAQEVLQIPKKETSKFKVSDFSSQLSIEYVLNSLYACLFNRNFAKNYHEQHTTPTAHF